MSRRWAVILDLVPTVGQSLASRAVPRPCAKLLGRVGDREMPNWNCGRGKSSNEVIQRVLAPVLNALAHWPPRRGRAYLVRTATWRGLASDLDRADAVGCKLRPLSTDCTGTESQPDLADTE